LSSSNDLPSKKKSSNDLKFKSFELDMAELVLAHNLHK